LPSKLARLSNSTGFSSSKIELDLLFGNLNSLVVEDDLNSDEVDKELEPEEIALNKTESPVTAESII